MQANLPAMNMVDVGTQQSDGGSEADVTVAPAIPTKDINHVEETSGRQDKIAIEGGNIPTLIG